MLYFYSKLGGIKWFGLLLRCPSDQVVGKVFACLDGTVGVCYLLKLQTIASSLLDWLAGLFFVQDIEALVLIGEYFLKPVMGIFRLGWG